MSIIDWFKNGVSRSTKDQLRQRARDLQVASNIAQQVAAYRDPGKLLAEAAERTRQSFQYYHVQVYLLDDETKTLVVQAGSGQAG